MVRTLLAALAAVAVVPAFGQALGTVTAVNGVATMVTGGNATTLTQGATVTHGARIVTTTSSSATLRLNSGCTLTVPPSHAVTLLSTQTCQQLQAALQPLTPPTAVMGQSSGGFRSIDPAVGIWGAGVIGTVIYDATRNENEHAAPVVEPPISGR